MRASFCVVTALVLFGFSTVAWGQESPAKGKAEGKTQPPAEGKAEGKTQPPAAVPAPPATTPPATTPATPPPDAAPPAAPAVDPKRPAAAEFAKAFEDWKTILKDLRKLKIQYQSADDAAKKPIEEQWTALVTKAAGLKAFAEAPNEDLQLSRFLVKLASDAAGRDEYESALTISEALITNNCDDKTVYGPAALAAYALHDFDKAAKYLKLATEAGAPPQALANVDLADYKKLWEEEQKIRAAEAAKDDLPRVKIATSKGDVVIELFENEAPEAVGNFISLIEQGFYNGTPFHRVLPNFMAQGGDPQGTGSGGPGYRIYCELDKPNFRRHFRGSLSMAHAGKDTGGSQFFLTFLPTSHLNGKHTCFGRVIEGLDVLPKLQRTDAPEGAAKPTPDTIVKAEVLRKRDHAYAPRKVQ
jgi:cyclophilin family peptidyl-prolyl cis-trans isomerase